MASSDTPVCASEAGDLPRGVSSAARGPHYALAGLAGIAIAAAFVPAPASAEDFGPLLGVEIPFDIERGLKDSVITRERPELDPIGIRASTFTIFPQVSTGLGFTSNVFGVDTGTDSDEFVEVRPSVRVQSDWQRHSLWLQGSAPIRRYFDNSIRNETGYDAAADVNLNIHGSSSLYGSLRYAKDYEAQYAGSFPSQSASTIPRRRLTALLGGTYTGNRLKLIGNFDVNRLNYSDTKTIAGAVLDQDFRDRTVLRGSARAEYAVNNATAIFGQLTYSDLDYRQTAIGLPERGSYEIRALAGVTFNLTSLVRAAAGAGYVSRNYQSAQYDTISGLAFDLRLEYLLSPITTVTAVARRDVEDAIVSTSPGYLSTTFQLRADHELLRNLVLYTRARYEHDNFKDITRTDDLYGFGAGGTYTLFRNVQLEPGAEYIKRDSRGEFIGRKFNEFRFLTTATLRI